MKKANVITIQQAAAELGCSPRKLYQARRRKSAPLPLPLIRSGRLRLVRRADLRVWLKAYRKYYAPCSQNLG